MSRIPREEQIGGLTVYHPRYLLIPKISMPLHGLLMLLGTFLLVRRLHKSSNFECIDSHYIYPDGFAAVVIGKLLGVPVIASARGTDMNLFPSFRLIQPMIRWALRHAQGLVAVSAALKEAMVEQGALLKNIVVIGNGIDVQRFQPLDRKEARAQLGLPAPGKILVSVGALIPLKGYQFLLPAVAQIAPGNPNLSVYIVGEGQSRKNLETMIRTLGLQEQVFLVGNRPNEELRLWFSAGDASCLVSSREGWPNVLLESMACGTPVVATRVGGIPEVIVSPDLGVMVEQEPTAIAQGLEFALQKSWDREALVRHARMRTWDTVAAEVEHFLASQTIANSKRGSDSTDVRHQKVSVSRSKE